MYSYKHVIGGCAVQTHLVQLFHRLETCSLGATAGLPAPDGGSWQCRRPDQIAIVPTARAKRAAVLELGNSAEPSTCVVADGLGLGKRLIVLATLGKSVSAHDICVN